MNVNSYNANLERWVIHIYKKLNAIIQDTDENDADKVYNYLQNYKDNIIEYVKFINTKNNDSVITIEMINIYKNLTSVLESIKDVKKMSARNKYNILKEFVNSLLDYIPIYKVPESIDEGTYDDIQNFKKDTIKKDTIKKDTIKKPNISIKTSNTYSNDEPTKKNIINTSKSMKKNINLDSDDSENDIDSDDNIEFENNDIDDSDLSADDNQKSKKITNSKSEKINNSKSENNNIVDSEFSDNINEDLSDNDGYELDKKNSSKFKHDTKSEDHANQIVPFKIVNKKKQVSLTTFKNESFIPAMRKGVNREEFKKASARPKPEEYHMTIHFSSYMSKLTKFTFKESNYNMKNINCSDDIKELEFACMPNLIGTLDKPYVTSGSILCGADGFTYRFADMEITPILNNKGNQIPWVPKMKTKILQKPKVNCDLVLTPLNEIRQSVNLNDANLHAFRNIGDFSKCLFLTSSYNNTPFVYLKKYFLCNQYNRNIFLKIEDDYTLSIFRFTFKDKEYCYYWGLPKEDDDSDF